MEKVDDLQTTPFASVTVFNEDERVDELVKVEKNTGGILYRKKDYQDWIENAGG